MNKTKFITIVIVIILALSVAIGIVYPLSIYGEYQWNLVWSDEFNGDTLNKDNWIYDIGGDGWGNNELQYYTDRNENVRVENGHLVIEAKKEEYGGMGYTSGRIKTKGLQEFKYGRIEAKMKMPKGQGLWPAFWMLGANMDSNIWPTCGEIDIMEHVNNAENIHGTIHWDYNGYQTYTGRTKSDIEEYHIYAIEWDDESIKWFVDDNKYLEANIKNNINGTDEFHKSFFILFNLAVGGNWPQSPNGNTKFPAKMMVDYVRVYEKGKVIDSGSNENNGSKDDKVEDVQKVSLPIFDIKGGKYATNQNIKITSATDGAIIRYTTDGSEPNKNSKEYKKPIEISNNTTIKAKAYKSGMNESSTVTEVYEIVKSFGENSEEGKEEKINDITWHLLNKPLKELGTINSSMSIETGSITGWQPVKLIKETPLLWYTDKLNNVIIDGNWSFNLWTDVPKGKSNVVVELYKVSNDGKKEDLICKKVQDVSTTGTGNHITKFEFGENKISCNDERIMIKIYKVSGNDVTMCYNGNDFDTKLYVGNKVKEDTSEVINVIQDKKWHLLSGKVKDGSGIAGETMETVASKTTGWQPVKDLDNMGRWWYTTILNGIYPKGKWNISIWTDEPKSNSAVSVEIYKVKSDGSNAALLARDTKDVFTTGTGNHKTTYSFDMPDTILKDERIMIKVRKESGEEVKICYNGNDFDSNLIIE
ncbi:family 16 glycosylhydrolase [Clostridium bornimense]|uniref:family 16 glycosylhydrolase n=1 Tax=Clostridium bornimense TaxID=1216932 RepID=UPI001C0FED8A|nr:family 16 glycosylhydrolase [Clostridium bornimense]MBU5317754.1 family 16 glycosylhydrolase [Clostridium bornimense]